MFPTTPCTAQRRRNLEFLFAYALVVAGFASAFAGLVIAVPLIGHASWHAYRGLIEAVRAVSN